MTSLLLHCSGARIVEGGAVVTEALECSIEAGRLALIGDWGPFFRLLAHEARLASGHVTVDGNDAGSGVRTGAIGLALLDPPLPEADTTTGYLGTGAELAGYSPRVARKIARSVIERLGLSRLQSRRIDALDVASRRALAIAQSLVTDPRTLVVESPLVRLDTMASGFLRQVLERAAHERRLLVSVGSPWSDEAERSLVESADRVAVMRNGQVVSVSPPEELLTGSRRYVVSTTRNGRSLANALAAKGLTVTRLDTPESDASDAGRLLVDLRSSGASTDPIIDTALEVEAPVVELVPVEPGAPGASE